jgi:hypothetical protein
MIHSYSSPTVRSFQLPMICDNAQVSKKGHHRAEQAPHKDRLDAGGFDFDACQPPTDY